LAFIQLNKPSYSFNINEAKLSKPSFDIKVAKQTVIFHSGKVSKLHNLLYHSSCLSPSHHHSIINNQNKPRNWFATTIITNP